MSSKSLNRIGWALIVIAASPILGFVLFGPAKMKFSVWRQAACFLLWLACWLLAWLGLSLQMRAGDMARKEREK